MIAEYAYLFGDRLLRGLSVFITEVLIARVLGLEFYGDYSYVLTALLISSTFITMGVDIAISQKVPKKLYWSPKVLIPLLLFGVVASVLSSYFMLREWSIFISLILLVKILAVLESIGHVSHMYKELFLSRFASFILFLGVKVVVLTNQNPLDGLAELLVALFFLEAYLPFFSVFFYRGRACMKYISDNGHAYAARGNNVLLLIVASSLLTTLMTRSDILIINFFSDSAVLGTYTAHMRSFEALFPIAVTLGIYASSKEYFGLIDFRKKIISRYLAGMFFIASTAYVLLGAIFAYLVLTFIWQIDVNPLLLLFFAVNLGFVFSNIVFTRIDGFTGNISRVLIRSAIGLFANIIVSLILVYLTGNVNTVVLGTLIAQMASFYWFYFWMKKDGYIIAGV